jgi:hypothetical protein
MEHDPLCPMANPDDHEVCVCDLLRRARADERAKCAAAAEEFVRQHVWREPWNGSTDGMIQSLIAIVGHKDA